MKSQVARNDLQRMAEPSHEIAERYWSPRRLVLSVTGESGRRIVVTDKPFARIGSDPTLEVVLPGGTVPALAAYLHATEDGVHLRRFTGRPPAGWIEGGSTIQFDDYEINVSTGGERLAVPNLPHLETRWQEGLSAPVVWLSHRHNGNSPVAYQLKRRLTLVGRQKLCHIKVVDSSISRFHCALYWDSRQLWVIDLHSRNGTEVNGRPVVARPAALGDAVNIGNVTLVIDSSASQPPAAAAPRTDRAVAPEAFLSAGESSDDVVDELALFLAQARQEQLHHAAEAATSQLGAQRNPVSAAPWQSNPKSDRARRATVVLDVTPGRLEGGRSSAGCAEPLEFVTDNLTQIYSRGQRKALMIFGVGLIGSLATIGAAAWLYADQLRFALGL